MISSIQTNKSTVNEIINNGEIQVMREVVIRYQ